MPVKGYWKVRLVGIVILVIMVAVFSINRERSGGNQETASTYYSYY